jgi:uncharacterized protein with HEPN domain
MPRDPEKHPMDDRLRAEHMLLAARDAVEMVSGRGRDDLESNTMLRRALINAVQEIGEAAAKVSAVGRGRLGAVRWAQMVGMRNRLVHGYDQINLDLLWNVATEEMAPLIRTLEIAFKSWPLPEPPDEAS